MQKHTQVEIATRSKKSCASRVAAVSQSNSDGSTVCSQSIGARTETEQNKSGETKVVPVEPARKSEKRHKKE